MKFVRSARACAVRVLAASVTVLSVTLGVGAVVAAGSPAASAQSSPTTNTPDVVSAMAAFPSGKGYWLANPDGGVYAFGSAPFLGSVVNKPIRGTIVGIAATPDGKGYWLASSGGAVYAFGDAVFHGSPPAGGVNGTIVGIAATPDGKGYWLASSGGSVYTQGDAHGYGSLAGKPKLGQVSAIASSPDGKGYWLASSAGGVYDYGDAKFHGHPASTSVQGTIVDMFGTANGQGYLLLSSEGRVYIQNTKGYGAPYGSNIVGNITALAPMPGGGGGYWVAAGGGGVYAYGSAKFYGSALPFAPGATGYDISQFQCPYYSGHNTALAPTGSHSLSIVQISGGGLTATQSQACLNYEAQWAGPNLMAYIFMNPDPASNLTSAAAYSYGYGRAQSWVTYARSNGIVTDVWWLDVETDGGWNTNAAAQATNSAEISGAVAGLEADGVQPGLYSTSYQWGVITGNAPNFPGILLWVPGAAAISTGSYSATAYCAGGTPAFAGGRVVMIQYGYSTSGETYAVDPDYACN